MLKAATAGSGKNSFPLKFFNKFYSVKPLPYSLDRTTLHQHYLSQTLSITGVIKDLLQRAHPTDPPQQDPTWILRLPADHIVGTAERLESEFKAATDKKELLKKYPLLGLPFSVKDNIDVAGFPTTAACPKYSYVPWETNPAVAKVMKAGAILIGKNNLDQFATGLVGVRSPYGTPINPFNKEYVPGGSSSGSAVAVSSGQVSFSFGTDTAGSGRIPAGFNNIIGLKPTRGILSARGVVPACKSLDTLSIFALTCDDAWAVKSIAEGYDPQYEYSRHPPPFSSPSSPFPSLATLPSPPLPSPLRLAIPKPLELFGVEKDEVTALFLDAIQLLSSKLPAEIIEIDFRPFVDVAKLLYDGPWVAERQSAIHDFLNRFPEHIHPITRAIIEKGKTYSSADTFNALTKLEKLRRDIDNLWKSSNLTALIVPTASITPTRSQVSDVPVGYNALLGYYTNFVNFLDMCAISVPNGFLKDSGMPSGITLISTTNRDDLVYDIGRNFTRWRNLQLGCTGHYLPSDETTSELGRAGAPSGDTLPIAVAGAHMSGFKLNYQLIQLGATLRGVKKTAPKYRIYDITKPGDNLRRPGIVRTVERTQPIEVEVWNLPIHLVGSFLCNLKEPLVIGILELEDGEKVHGFLSEGYGVLESAIDITDYGGWRNYLNAAKL